MLCRSISKTSRCVATVIVAVVLLAALPAAAAGPSAGWATAPGGWLASPLGLWIEAIAGPWLGGLFEPSPAAPTGSSEYQVVTAADGSGEVEPPPDPGTGGGQLPCWGFCTTGGSSSDPNG